MRKKPLKIVIALGIILIIGITIVLYHYLNYVPVLTDQAKASICMQNLYENYEQLSHIGYEIEHEKEAIIISKSDYPEYDYELRRCTITIHIPNEADELDNLADYDIQESCASSRGDEINDAGEVYTTDIYIKNAWITNPYMEIYFLEDTHDRDSTSISKELIKIMDQVKKE